MIYRRKKSRRRDLRSEALREIPNSRSQVSKEEDREGAEERLIGLQRLWLWGPGRERKQTGTQEDFTRKSCPNNHVN